MIIQLEDYVKEQYDDGDDNSSSNSGTSGFQDSCSSFGP